MKGVALSLPLSNLKTRGKKKKKLVVWTLGKFIFLFHLWCDVDHFVYKVNFTLVFMEKPACTVFKFMSYQSFILQKILKPFGKV